MVRRCVSRVHRGAANACAAASAVKPLNPRPRNAPAHCHRSPAREVLRGPCDGASSGTVRMLRTHGLRRMRPMPHAQGLPVRQLPSDDPGLRQLRPSLRWIGLPIAARQCIEQTHSCTGNWVFPAAPTGKRQFPAYGHACVIGATSHGRTSLPRHVFATVVRLPCGRWRSCHPERYEDEWSDKRAALERPASVAKRPAHQSLYRSFPSLSTLSMMCDPRQPRAINVAPFPLAPARTPPASPSPTAAPHPDACGYATPCGSRTRPPAAAAPARAGGGRLP